MAYGISGVLTLFGENQAVYLASLGIAILITGILSGAAYFSVYALVPKWWRGRVIAGGIGGGALIQFLVEFSKALPHPDTYLYIYTGAFLVVVAIMGVLLLEGDILRSDVARVSADKNTEPENLHMLLILLAAAVVIIAYLSALYEGVISIVYTAEEQSILNTRLLYCVSVVAAGLVADLKGRRYLALISVGVMTILILDVFLLNYPAVKILNWIILFLGAGFLAMFVTLTFIDVAHLTPRPALWTGAGRIIKHLASAVGSVLGVYLWSNPNTGLLVIITQYLILLIALIFLLFKLYQMLMLEKAEADIPALAAPDVSPIAESELLHSGDELLPYNLKIEKYRFTEREKQVLASIIASSSIKEIAAGLYISERTVKFHIKNILTKTDTKNQKDLLAKLMLSSNAYGEEQN
ncbi:MAG: LuxR family transcriptional regulator [Syntrophomonadaceae bacterium]|nr:LuxR family transcriptional regulator [Syntrophomonadaceae bacterium]MDD4562809.1 LuxR family transcriptional regulator [Syntrophomonadaceae bacterium]